MALTKAGMTKLPTINDYFLNTTFTMTNNNESVSQSDFVTAAPRTNMHTPSYIYVYTTFSFAVIFFVGVSGNILVSAVVGRNRSMRSSTNVFLVNLSMADLMVLVACMPTGLAELYCQDAWYLGSLMCKLVPFLENLATHASSLTILAISFERYYAICFPLKAQYICTLRRTYKIIASIWVVAIVVTSPFIYLASLDPALMYDGREVYVCRTSMNLSVEKGYIIALGVIFFGLPLIILLFLYGCIIRCLTTSNDLGLTADGQSNSNNLRQRRQVVLMLLCVICVFFVCLLPFRVFSLWLVYAPPHHVQELGLVSYLNVLQFVRIMHYLNSATNPILYNLISRRFRRATKLTLLAMIPCRKDTQRSRENESSRWIYTQTNMNTCTVSRQPSTQTALL